VTTVAWDGETLSADTGSLLAGLIDQHPTEKIFKRGKKLYGVAGDFTQAVAVVDFISGKTKKPPVFMGEPSFDIIEVSKTGAAVYSNEFYGYPVGAPHAIGSGCHIALSAMLCGKTSKQAVKLAIKLDPSTNGKVRTFKL